MGPASPARGFHLFPHLQAVDQPNARACLCVLGTGPGEEGTGPSGDFIVPLRSSDLALPTHLLLRGFCRTTIITSESTSPQCPAKASPVHLRWAQLLLCTCKAVPFCHQDGCGPRQWEAWSARPGPRAPQTGTSPSEPSRHHCRVWPLAVSGKHLCFVSRAGQNYRPLSSGPHGPWFP